MSTSAPSHPGRSRHLSYLRRPILAAQAISTTRHIACLLPGFGLVTGYRSICTRVYGSKQRDQRGNLASRRRTRSLRVVIMDGHQRSDTGGLAHSRAARP